VATSAACAGTLCAVGWESPCDPCFPISGASCRRAGTAPARSNPRGRAGGSARSAEPERPERRRSAPGLGKRRTCARSASPFHARAVSPRPLPISRPWARRNRQNGPFARGVTASLRRERCGPAVTRRARGSLRSARPRP
jgi:hypothetical protein